MPQPKELFDPKCYELAEYFLLEEKADTADNRDALAAVIQTAIEDWLETADC